MAQDDGNADTTQPNADTANIDILDAFCRKIYNFSVQASKLSTKQIGSVFVSLFVVFAVYWGIQKAFLVILCIIIIVVLWVVLCRLYDYVTGKFKSEVRDIKEESRASKTVKVDIKDVSGDDGQDSGVLEEENTSEEKDLKEQARASKSVKVDVKDEPGEGGLDSAVLHSEKVREITDPYMTMTAHRGSGFAVAEGEKEVVRKYFYYIKERVYSDWLSLARILGLNYLEIENIRARNHEYKSCCMDMLELWLRRKGRVATIEVLMEALLSDAGLEHVAYDLKSQYPELRNVATQQE
ncbi:PREDICTED: uncharacterized protein LOC109476343 [Branchiostoma belcheri]|uniref:Uncharacterized protein LOC109476343 n=1 Tax=Branchiostoma belcheri TaxID=7741 RepID=A0A6P4ZFU5_BRABE|nr:PREDICTED: uncharacterized protein LOC109476343 [Branchiostoma belcheri]